MGGYGANVESVDLWFEDRKFGSRLACLSIRVFLAKTLNPIMLLVVIGYPSDRQLSVWMCVCAWTDGTVMVKHFGPYRKVEKPCISIHLFFLLDLWNGIAWIPKLQMQSGLILSWCSYRCFDTQEPLLSFVVKSIHVCGIFWPTEA